MKHPQLPVRYSLLRNASTLGTRGVGLVLANKFSRPGDLAFGPECPAN